MASPGIQHRQIGQGRLNSPLRRHRLVRAQLPEGSTVFVETWLERVKDFFANEAAHVPLDEGLEVEDVIEGLCVQYSILLVPNLPHHRTTMRTAVFDLFFELVLALNNTLRDDEDFAHDRDLLLTVVGQEHPDLYGCIDKLFHLIGKHLDFVTLGLVAGLELYYTHPSVQSQQVAIAVVTRLIVENPNLFIQRDNLAAIWNLFFRLDISAPTYRNPALVGCRGSVCRSLALLAPMFCRHDQSLARQCLLHLLVMPDKSQGEMDAIKHCLKALFSEYRKFEDVETRTSLFEVFLHAISAQYEDNYDLLGWALLACANTTIIANTPNSADPVLEFVGALENHFHASSPPLVRYGAVICLSTLIPVYPIVIEKYPRVFSIVICGCLDTHPEVAGLHLELLKFICEKLRLNRIATSINSLLTLHDLEAPISDPRSADGNAKPAVSPEARLVGILQEARIHAPEVPPQELSVMLSNLEFATDYQRHRQLLLLQVLSGSATQVDPLFLQTLLPHLRSADPEQQVMAIGILESLATALGSPSTSTHLIDGVESYCKALLRTSQDGKVVPKLLAALSALPFDRIDIKKRHDLLDCLLHLIYSPVVSIRCAASAALGQCASFWKGDELIERAFALCILSLADRDPDCVNAALSSIEKLRQSTQEAFNDVVAKVDRVIKIIRGRYILNKLGAFDILATAILVGKKKGASRLRALFERDTKMAKHVGTLFSSGDGHQAHFCHLAALIYSRINSPATHTNYIDDSQRRAMSFLKHDLGNPDTVTRRAACFTVRRMCVLGEEARYGYVRHVLKVTLPYLLESKIEDMKENEHWVYIESSLCICRLLMLLKIRHINPYIISIAFDRVLEIMETEPSYPVKAACVEFFEVVLLTNPLTIADRLERMRDSFRLLFCFPHASLTDVLTRVYPLIFRQASLRAQVAQDYMTYLKNDLGPALGESWEQDMDPLLAKLSPAELKNIVVTSVHGLGSMRSRFLALPIIQELLFFLHHPDPDLRLAALQALHSQLTMVDKTDSVRPKWIALPLIGDPIPRIRDAYGRFLREILPILDYRQDEVKREEDDAIPDSMVKDEDLVTAVAPPVVNMDDKDLTFPIYRLDPELLNDGERSVHSYLDVPKGWLTAKPAPAVLQVSSVFLKRIQRTINQSIGPITDQVASEVVYHLNAFVNIHGLQSAALLVLSELWKEQIGVNPDQSYVVSSVEVLLYHIKQNLTRNTSNVIHACALALKNLADSSEVSTVEILDRLTANPSPTEGELVGLRYLAEAVEDYVVERSSSIVHSHIRFVLKAGEMNRPSLQNAAIQVCATYALISGNQDISDVIECLVLVRSKTKIVEVIRECDQSLGNILRSVGRDHPNIQQLINIMISKLQHKSPNTRLLAMDQFHLFCPFMNTDEMVLYSIRLLADPHIPVREKIIDILFEGHHPSLLNEAKKVAKTLTAPLESSRGDKLWGIMRGKARTAMRMQKILASRKQKKEPLIVPMPTVDYLNRAYLSSKDYTRWVKFWSLGKSGAPQGLQRVESAFNVFLPQSAAIYDDDIATLKEAVLTDVAPLVRTFLLLDRQKGELILTELNNYVSKVLEGEFDRGTAIYNISLLTQILQSCDGVRDDVPIYLESLHKFVTTCHERIEELRRQIFENLDNFKFFSTTGASGPITSEQQFSQMMEHRRMLEVAVQDKNESARLLAEHKKFHREVAEDNATLRDLTFLMSKTIDGLGGFYAICEHLDEEYLVSGFSNIYGIMGNTHRGVRDCTRTVIVDVALAHVDSVYTEASARPQFVSQVQDTLGEIWKLLSNDVHQLKRRKLDYLHILAYLLHLAPDKENRIAAIKYIMSQWDSPDGAIRRYSIKLTQHLCESGVQEMVELLDADNGQPSVLMSELTKRLGDSEYLEKDSLNHLMKWYFARAGDLGMSMYARQK